MVKLIECIIDEESGQGMVEYAFIIALIVIIAVGSVILLGEKTQNLYDDTLSAMTP
jgi:Flp pilus assembly pilin Flp